MLCIGKEYDSPWQLIGLCDAKLVFHILKMVFASRVGNPF